MEVLITLLGMLALIVILVLYDGLAWGFVLYRLWYWFAVPVFPHLPQITYLQSVGLFFLISLFHSHRPAPEYEGLKQKREYSVFLAPWIVLSISWIFHNWII